MEKRHFQKVILRMKLFLSLQSFTCHIVNIRVWKYVFICFVIKIKVFHSCRTRIVSVALVSLCHACVARVMLVFQDQINLFKLNQKFFRNSSAIFRSSHRCSIKIAILKQFLIFAGKHLCWGLSFNKCVGLQVCNFIKRRLQHRYFLVNIGKFMRTPILKTFREWLLLHFQKVFCKHIFQIRTQQRQLLMKQKSSLAV